MWLALVLVLAMVATACAGHGAPPPRSSPGGARGGPQAFDAESVDIAVDWEGAPPPSTIGVKPAFTELHLAFENTVAVAK